MNCSHCEVGVLLGGVVGLGQTLDPLASLVVDAHSQLLLLVDATLFGGHVLKQGQTITSYSFSH